MQVNEKKIFNYSVRYILLGALAIVMAFPFYWMVTTGLKKSSALLTFPPDLLVHNITWSNFIEIFSSLPFGLFYLNSTIVTLTVVIGQLFICSLAGYAFARIDFPGSKLLFSMLLSALLIPHIVVIIPRYILFMRVGMLNTLWPLIIPPMFANTFGTFLMRQYYKTLPPELDDAARIDGASKFQIYWKIMVPLSRAPLATVGVLNFVWNWNRFLDALIFIDDIDKMTVPLGVAALQGEFSFDYSLVMAGATLAVVPVVILFMVFQKYFIAGISLNSGFKS